MGQSNKEQLTSRQEAAINLLITGTTMANTAEVLEVPYSTIRRWVSANSRFQQELNKLRQQVAAGQPELKAKNSK